MVSNRPGKRQPSHYLSWGLVIGTLPTGEFTLVVGEPQTTNGTSGSEAILRMCLALCRSMQVNDRGYRANDETMWDQLLPKPRLDPEAFGLAMP